MTTETAPPSIRAPGLFRPLAAGLIVACLSAVFSISAAVLLFDGPLQPMQPAGIAVLISGGIVYGLAGAFFGTQPGTWWGNQTMCVAVLALGAQAHVASATHLPPEVMAATMIAYIALATLLSGLALLAVGLFRVADYVRIIPHPVIGGFLAATGLFLTYRGAELAANAHGLADILQPGAMMRWVPVLAGALLLVGYERARGGRPVLLPALGLMVAGFYAYLWLTGLSFGEADARGLLMDAPTSVADVGGRLARGSLALVDLEVIAATIPAILSCAALAVLGLLINVSGIEVITGQPARLNLDFRRSGVANILVALIGGVPGFHSASTAHLTLDETGRASRSITLAAVGFLALLLAAGLPLVGYIPSAAVAFLLVFIGIGLLWQWLFAEARAMTWADRAIVLVILAAAILFGFATAIAIGFVTSTLLFALAYSRIDVVRSATTGRQRMSGTERGEAQIAELQARGAETRIYELQGYLFFGTAERLYARVAQVFDETGPPARRMIFDFRRVAGMDVSAAQMFRKLARHAQERGIELAFSDLSPDLAARLAGTGVLGAGPSFPALSEALGWAEDAVLAGARGLDARIDPDMRDILDRLDAAIGPAGLPRREIGPGETLFAAGAPSNSLAVLEDGALVATIRRADGTVQQVARFLPGAVVGEIGLYTATPRTATVTADAPSVIRQITDVDIARLTRTEPALVAELHHSIAKLLAKRLGRTTALLFAIDR